MSDGIKNEVHDISSSTRAKVRREKNITDKEIIKGIAKRMDRVIEDLKHIVIPF